MLARLCLVVALTLAIPAAADDPAAKPAIAATIAAQIEAFLDGDLDRAFGYAADTIRDRFGTPEAFGDMVRDGYPMVWRPAEWRFLDLREIGGVPWQRVMIRDGAGRVHMLDYAMQRAEDGWRIRAVHILHPPEAGA